MAYYAKALATKPDRNSHYIKRIHEIRDMEYKKSCSSSTFESIEQLNKDKEEIILKTLSLLLNLQHQLEEDPLVKNKKTQLMIKNLQRHLEKVNNYTTSF